MGSSYCMQNLHEAFAPVDKWKQKLHEIWSTNGLERTENHFDDCYFCTVNIIGINRNNQENGLTLIYLQPGDLFRTRILYPFHVSVNYHSSQRMSLACLLSH